MAKKYRDPVPLTETERYAHIATLGEPFWAPGQPDFTPPEKGSVEWVACQTSGCSGRARMKVKGLLAWFWEPDSFYCVGCGAKRGAISVALTCAMIFGAAALLMFVQVILRGLIR